VAGLNSTNWTGPARVRVIRRTRPMDESEISQLLCAALQRDYVKDLGQLEIHFSQPWNTITVPDEPLTVTLTDVPATGVSRTFMAGFEIWKGKERVGKWQATLVANVWRDVPLAHSPLARGQLLRDADIVMERRDVLMLRDALLNFSRDDGSLELTESIQTGMPVVERSVHVRPLIKRGQMVDAVYEDGALRISLKVETLEDGLPGQSVRVRNPKTNREFYGKVQNEDSVSINL